MTTNPGAAPMELHELDDLLPGLGIDPTYDELRELLAVFQSSLVASSLIIDGLRVKVILAPARKVRGYEHLPETFVHLITRKGARNERVFDRYRANKLHWVRCILEHRAEEEISYFKYPEPNGVLRDYFWYKEGDFLVIMERVAPDFLVITSFCIDNRHNQEYFEEREKWYKVNRPRIKKPGKLPGLKNMVAAITGMRPPSSFSLWEMKATKICTVPQKTPQLCKIIFG